jgi:hypothetical protein
MAGRALKRSRKGRRINAPRTQETGQLGAGYFAAQNKDTETIFRGQVVAIHPSGSGVIKASALDDSKNAVGFMSQDTAVGATQNVATDEVFSMPDWSNVTGTTELQGGQIYFLGTVPGRMSTVPPSTNGQVVQQIGRATSPTAIEIECKEAILL